METLKKNAANLLKVKTIVTIMLTIVFCALALTGTITGADFLTVFAVVIAFYFGTQTNKGDVATGGYTGPQQSGETVNEYTEHFVESVDEAQAQEIHPPDEEKSLIGFNR